MDLGLSGRSVLVTGGSKGIGLACARAFQAEGCRVHIAARDRARLEQARKELGGTVAAHCADLRDAKSLAALAAECAGVDILVNNAGDIPGGTLEALDEAKWRHAWELKVFGYINLTREYYRRMVERHDGVIVNVIGIGGEKLEYAYAAGSTGNAALAAMTRAVGSVSLDYGVRVLGVHPGWVETERARRSLRRRAEQELGDAERWPELTKAWPRGGLIQPREIGEVVAFAASARASAMSGVILTVDGGFAARGYPHDAATRPA